MDISFKFDPEVLIGSNTLSMAGTIASRHGSRIMIAADHSVDAQTVNRLKEILTDSGLEAIIFDGIDDSSSVEMSENIVELSRAAHCDAIIGFGGQKAQIISRMAAIMAPMHITAFELLDGRNFGTKFLPFISIPTEGMSTFTATNYFIAIDPRSRLVKSIPSPADLYSAIIIDSSLFTFMSGNNAMPKIFEGFFCAIEAFCSARANFISDALLERAISFYTKLLRGSNGAANGATNVASEANTELFTQASFLTALGSCASSPGIGAVLSKAINARTTVPKALCSAVLCPVIAEKLVSARPEKMSRIASFLGAPKPASVADGAASSVEAIKKLMTTLNVPTSLTEYNIQLDRLTAASEAARSLDLTANSPWTVSEEEIFKILKQIL